MRSFLPEPRETTDRKANTLTDPLFSKTTSKINESMAKQKF
jgi:hypothetical protein